MSALLSRAGAALLVLMLAGCATMSESDCRYADWRQIGERDARQGRTADYFADRAGACREHGLAADETAYRAGWRRGLEQFCTPDSGFRHGLEGDGYHETCPGGRERAFLAGYGLGLDIHRAGEHLDRLDREIASLQEDLDEHGDRDSDEARRIERDIRDRRDEIRRVERELGRLEAIAAERGFFAGGY